MKIIQDEDLCIETNLTSGNAEARLWCPRGSPTPGDRLGVIGGFQASSAEAAADLLGRAVSVLRQHGSTLAVGPMDGNTWRKYRFVTDPGSEPSFFMEPSNPPEWPLWWQAAGFGPLAEYYSAVTSDLSARDPRLDGVEARMAAAGVTIRPIDPSRFEKDLGLVYDVSVISFQDNYLYTPLSREEFLAQYLALRERVVPGLVLIAEHGGKPVGYIFAIPDFAQAQRGEPVTTAIVKTLAVLPSRSNAGLGALLLGRVHGAALSLGFTRAIHALMHQSNKSRNLSAHYAHTLRRYTLFSKRIAP